MNTIRNGYHHYLNNANVTILASGSKYPVVTPQPGTVMGDRSDQNRRCMMCHVEHDIFKPELNWQSPGRSYNLRFDVSILPNRTAHGNNTDFVPSTSPDAPKAPNGGICLSCHQNSQFKSYTQADGTTRTPIINRNLFEGSPHNFTAPATFNSNATIFNGNCSKCHIDTLNKSKQGAGNAFGPHYSKVRRIQAGSTDINNTGNVSTIGTDSTHLADSTKGWGIDIWQGFTVKIIDGTGVGQSRSIINNDATILTLSSAWTTTPNTTSKYLIGISREFDSGKATGGSSTKISDNTMAWTRNYWKDRPITIIAGTGRGQTKQITYNTATSIGASWSPAPDTTSEYSIGDPMEEEQCYKCHSRQSNPNAYQYKDYYGQKLFDNTKTLKMEELFNDAAKPYKHRIANYFAKHRGDESITAPTGATATGWYGDINVSGGLHTGCVDCHNPHGNRKPGEDNGVATGGSAGSIGPPLVPGILEDSSKNWSMDQWRGYTLRLMDGAGRGQDRIIVGNTPTSLTLAASFVTAPANGTYYIITPIGLPNKGNNLWNPNSGIWGVAVSYGTPTVDTMAAPTFKKITTMTAGTNKIYQLCFKCHSEYGWGTSGTPFTIPDSFNASGGLAENQTTNIAQEFNPNNLGHHPVVDIGANQPINATGYATVDIVGSAVSPMIATGGSATSVTYANTWNPNKYNGMCVEITGGTGSGQVRSITGHNSTGITAVDPNFTTAPANGSQFVIRKCSSFASSWPRFTGGTLELTADSPTARIKTLTNGIPSTVINGWYIYAGTVSGSPLAPPQLTTKGWFQITGISAGASNSGTTDVYLTITPTPTQSYNSTYALTAGLGNTFVPPYGPWSVMGCADCHDTDDSRDPSGPHASARNWMVRMLESQIFAWYYGGTGEGASTTDPSLVKVVGYPDGGDLGWSRDLSKIQCLNCHRSDVYTANNIAVSGGSFVNYAARNMGRQTHLPYDVQTYNNSYGIFCMYCHGGDNRPIVSGSWSGAYNQALGGVHGSNLGVGTNSTQSFRGRRLINGGSWTGITRSATNAQGTCSTRGSNISNCGSYGGGISNANYPYFSGADMYLPTITSAVAADASGGHTGVQAGDTVVIRFDGETQANAISPANINSALAITGKPSGWGSIASAVWSTTTYQYDTLTVTLGTGATVAVGDTITVGGNGIKNILGMSITGSTSVTGSFGFWVISAIASDASGGGPDIQTGDQVVIRFDGSTIGTSIDAGNVNLALELTNPHVWGTIQSATWSDTTYVKDTLTITLSTSGVTPTVASGDTITLGAVIKDSFNNTITNPQFMITGTFSSIPTGAVGHWRFDENTGTIANDDTTNYNHGSITNGSWTTGKSGSAVSYNGSSTYVNVPDSDTLDLTTAGTLEMWVKKNNTTCGYQYISKGNDYRLYEDGSCRVVFKWGTGTLSTTQSLTMGAWYHIVATYDAAGNRNIYVNGQNKATATSVTNAAVNATDLRIGNYSATYFNGIIDSVVVYNRALSAQEAFERYNRIKSATANNNSGLGAGIQANDQVVIRFNTPIQLITIDASNINSALALSGGHSWRDGSNNIGSANWSTTTYTNDTLTITLTTATSAPTVKVGDVISTAAGIIKDSSGKPVIGTIRVGGSFGAVTGMPDGVIGYWKLDETSGQTVSDSSANVNNGTLGTTSAVNTEDPVWTTSGRFIGALNFDGSNDNVTVPDSDSLDISDQVTIELWINKDTNKSQSYLSKGVYVTSGGDEYALYENDTTGTLRFRWGGTIVSSASPVLTGNWNHIVGTYDGTTARLYVNGVESANAAAFSMLNAGGDPLYIGRNSSGFYADGKIDDVVVYNRALSAGEVAGRYAANLKAAVIRDTAGNGRGMQAGDKVVITFDGPTNGATINTGNINSALLISGHTWGAVSAGWSNTLGNNNDTLTITLSDLSSTVNVGDTLTLAGGYIQDTSARPIIGSTIVGGSFDSLLTGVVGYWNFDENSGVTVYDASTNSNHGLLASTTWATGWPGYGISFNNSSSKITIADSNSLDLTSAGTIEFWVKKANDTASSSTYVYKQNAYYIYDNGTTGQLTFKWSTGTALITDMRINAGIWYHIAAVYDGANLKIYINGELSKSVAYSTNATANTNPLYIGNTGSSLNLYGVMDGLVIYNRALNATEIRQRYGSNIKSADADDNSGSGAGIQANDRVIIKFSEATNADTISAGNINSALALNAGSWLDGAGDITSANWSTTTYTNDTLTITLRANTSAPTMRVGNTITLNGTIKDSAGYPIYGSIAIGGSFGAISGMPDGVVGYWKLDEPNGTAAADQSMNTNNGTVTGATWTTGRYNNALSFSGSNQYVTVADSNSLDLFKTGTIEFWTKKNANNNNQTYISKGSAVPYFLVDESGTTGRIRFYWGDGTVTTTNAVPLGVWNHIACVYNGTDLRIYINGVLAVTPAAFQLHTLAPNGSALYLGRSQSGTYLNGSLDDVVIYNRALSAGEVQQRFVNTFRDARSYDISLADTGVQVGDQVVIRFIGATDGPVISAGNIDSALPVNGGAHTWKDVFGGIGSANWSNTTGYNNDTLTITLSATNGIPTVAGGDTIGLGTLIKDSLGRSITGTTTILNDFDVPIETIGYWRYDASNGTSAYDTSASANNGTVTGATWTTGKFNNALSFNGVSDWYVSYPAISDYTLSGNYTMEAWVKPTSWPTSGDGAILYNGGAFFLYNFALYSDGKIGLSYNSTGSMIGRNIAKATTPLTLNDWNHVLITRNAGIATFYVNGVASTVSVNGGGATATFTENHYTTTNGSLYTGRSYFNPDYYYFPGIIDEVVMYKNKSLTASEVKRRYRTWMSSVRANNNSGGGSGIQSGDQVVIKFDGATTAQTIDAGNIETALELSNEHTWGSITSANWSTTTNTNDTLTITLNTGATVNVGDTITLGGVIKDDLYRTITGTKLVGGSFAPIPSGAVAYYKIDETAGTTLVDGTTNNNHGTIYGGASRTAGKSGTGLTFDGTDDYVEVANTTFSLANAMSVEVWVKAADQPNGNGVVDANAAGIKSWSSGGNEVIPAVTTTSGYAGSGFVVGGNVFDNTNWHHLVLTWDGTTQYLYVDGNTTPVGSKTWTGTLVANTILRLGRMLDGTGFYNGQIDEVVIYNTALTPAQVNNRYNNP